MASRLKEGEYSERVRWREGGGVSAHRYSKQIKSDVILRGCLRRAGAGVWSRCQLEDLYASAQSISRLNEAMEKHRGQNINREAAFRI